MKNIYSNIYSFNKKSYKKTIKALKKGNIVSLPTETVYGLAGNAYSKKSVNKIFNLKKRPSYNPLIIHYHDLKKTYNDIVLNKYFLKLYKKFCPGPLTFILKKNKNSRVVSSATANLRTIAIRFPNNRKIRAILKILNFPLAMPSANISSSLSPVTAYDVCEEFKNKVKIIINGGRSKVGIESTVIDLTEKPKILRPGIISSQQIKNCLKVNFSKRKSKIKSPGMLKKHYSPGIPIILGKKPSNDNYAFIVYGKKFKDKKNYFNLSKKADLTEAAANLYKTMRKIKKLGFKKIFVTKIPNIGAGIAINDRLTRASR